MSSGPLKNVEKILDKRRNSEKGEDEYLVLFSDHSEEWLASSLLEHTSDLSTHLEPSVVNSISSDSQDPRKRARTREEEMKYLQTFVKSTPEKRKRVTREEAADRWLVEQAIKQEKYEQEKKRKKQRSERASSDVVSDESGSEENSQAAQRVRSRAGKDQAKQSEENQRGRGRPRKDAERSAARSEEDEGDTTDENTHALKRRSKSSKREILEDIIAQQFLELRDYTGYRVGNTPAQFNGLVRLDNVPHIFCSWVGENGTSFVPLHIIAEKFPKMLVSYLESKLQVRVMRCE